MGGDFFGSLAVNWERVLTSALAVIPRVLALLGLLLLGWVVALVLRGLTRWILRSIRIGALIERAGMDRAVGRLHIGSVEQLVGSVVFWAIWTTFLISGLHALGIPALDQLAGDVVRLLVKLVTALALVMVGMALSNFVWRLVLLAAVNARIREARLIGGTARWLVIFGTIAMSLEQLELGGNVVHTAFAILFGGVVLAGALALGLGGRHAARRFIEQRLLAQESPDKEGGAHL